MNLQQLIERFVSYREALGGRCRGSVATLRAFGRAIGATADVTDVRAEQVTTFLAGAGPLTSSWHIKYSALLGFYNYAKSRGHVTVVPLPAERPKAVPSFVPYIYSREEIRLLLDAAEQYQRGECSLEPATVRIILLLLYATGLRDGEVVRLDQADVDLNEGLLTVRLTKFHKSRLVPFSAPVSRALTEYVNTHPTPASLTSECRPFFATRQGNRIDQKTLQAHFQQVRARSGIRRSDGARYQPRLHDLRHTFAVHRLISWYRQGADVQKLLPQLSVYLGHAHLADTQTYLSMTTELLQQANIRFERYVETGGQP